MRQLNSNKMRLAVIGIMAAIVLGSGNAKADFIFGEPVNLGPVVNSPNSDSPMCVSPDGLELYFMSDEKGPLLEDIWITNRATVDDDWGSPQKLGPVINSPGSEFSAGMSFDGLTLYFSSDRAGGSGGLDLWKSTRAHNKDLWTTPVNLGPIVNSQYHDYASTISPNGMELYFMSNRPGGLGGYFGDIWLTTRNSLEEPWGEPVNPSVLNSEYSEGFTYMSPDGLTLFLESDRPGTIGDFDIWLTRRKTLQDAWSTPTHLGSTINSLYFDGLGPLTPDGRTMYFSSTRPGGLGGEWGDIWQASIEPVVDLNSDGIIDAADLCIIVDHWGTDNSLCDIGPMPWGDGIVDVEDLIILAEHLFEEYPPVEVVE